MSNLSIPQSIQLSVDDNEKVELAEIQAELNESRAQNDELEAQLLLYRQRLSRCESTSKAISQLDSDTTTWLTIGKMFVKNTRSEVETELEKELKMYQKKVSDLEVGNLPHSIQKQMFGIWMLFLFRLHIVGYWSTSICVSRDLIALLRNIGMIQAKRRKINRRAISPNHWQTDAH